MPKTPAMPEKLDYLCLQPMRQGQASYAHVNEIVAGLERRGWQVRLIQPPLPTPGRADALRRAASAGLVQLRYWVRAGLRPAPFVYIRTHFLSIPTAVLARVSGSIVIQEVNGPLEDGYDAWPQLRRFGGLIRFLCGTQWRWADLIITVTPGLVDYVRQFSGPGPAVVVIGNGADVDRFTPRPAALPPGERTYVVFVGALASWQGIDTVIAAAQSPGWPSGLDLVIAGDGRERDLVAAAARELPHVRWLGSVSYAEAADLVSGSFASLVPKNVSRSTSEFGLSPLKLFEGMAAGVPVVVSDLPGLTDVVTEHACGVTFPAGDAPALAAAVAGLAADPVGARAMGERGRAAALERYSWDARAGQTDQALRDVAARRHARRRPGRSGSAG